MTNKTTTLVLWYAFLVASLFYFYGINIICSSIFFSTHFIVETLEKLNKK